MRDKPPQSKKKKKKQELRINKNKKKKTENLQPNWQKRSVGKVGGHSRPLGWSDPWRIPTGTAELFNQSQSGTDRRHCVTTRSLSILKQLDIDSRTAPRLERDHCLSLVSCRHQPAAETQDLCKLDEHGG